MIIKRIKSSQGRRAGATANYIKDLQHEGAKVVHTGTLNCLSEKFNEAQSELEVIDLAYTGKGDACSHWIMSWQEGETPSPAQVKVCWKEFLKDQGMQDHPLIFACHADTNNFHSHAVVSRLKTDGSFEIQKTGGVETWNDAKKYTHEVKSARFTVLRLCEKYGWQEDFKHVSQPRPADEIRLGQRVEAWEAQHNCQHPKRQVAEISRDILRQATSWQQAHSLLEKHEIAIEIKKDKNGKTLGAVVKNGKNSIKLSALPRDCSLKNLEKRYGGGGNSSEHKTTTIYNDTNLKNTKKLARQAINSASNFKEMAKNLASQGLKLQRQGKQGAYLVDKNGDKIKLSSLGKGYSLFQLQKKYEETLPIFSTNIAARQEESNKISQKVTEVSQKATSVKETADNIKASATSAATSIVDANTLDEVIDQTFASIELSKKASKLKSLQQKFEAQAKEQQQKQREIELAQREREERRQKMREKAKKVTASSGPASSLQTTRKTVNSNDLTHKMQP